MGGHSEGVFQDSDLTRIHWVSAQTRSAGRTYRLLLEGLRAHPGVELVDGAENPDWYFYPWQSYRAGMPYKGDLDKLVFLTFEDSPIKDGRPGAMPHGAAAYFVCSWLWPQRLSDGRVEKIPFKWPANFHPMAYAIMDGMIGATSRQLPFSERSIDVGCYLRAGGGRNRVYTLQVLREARQLGATRLGPVSKGGRGGYEPVYYTTLGNTKILVTCQPTLRLGDGRTWEALAAGCLVFVDKLQNLSDYPLVHGQHCVYFDPTDGPGLIAKVRHFLRHPAEAMAIAALGQAFAMRYHRSVNRIESILRILRPLLKKRNLCEQKAREKALQKSRKEKP